jgi:hypothetical protein
LLRCHPKAGKPVNVTKPDDQQVLGVVAPAFVEKLKLPVTTVD